MKKKIVVIRWKKKKAPTESEIKAFFAAEGLKPYSWSNGPYDTYAKHNHSYTKVLYCVSGSIDFIIIDEDKRITLRPGDKLIVPQGVYHAAEVGPEGVVCMEAPRK